MPDKERCKLPEWVSGYGKVDGDDHQTKGHVFGGSEVRMMYDCIVHTTEKERERERESMFWKIINGDLHQASGTGLGCRKEIGSCHLG